MVTEGVQTKNNHVSKRDGIVSVKSQKKNLLEKLKENVSLGFLVIKKHVLKITPPYFLQNSTEGGGVICSDIV